MIAYSLNTRTHEAEADRTLSVSLAWSTHGNPGQRGYKVKLQKKMNNQKYWKPNFSECVKIIVVFYLFVAVITEIVF